MSLDDAVRVYWDRRDRREHPEGQFDNAMRWYPSNEEQQTCCRAIRTPSRAYPYSLMVHCRTAQHVANLCGVETSELRRAAR